MRCGVLAWGKPTLLHSQKPLESCVSCVSINLEMDTGEQKTDELFVGRLIMSCNVKGKDAAKNLHLAA